MSEARHLIKAHRATARAASENAFSPYSGFRVGAAVVGANGKVYAGCNVENASYGLTQCAERNALGAAITAGMKKGTATAMVIYLPGNEALPPCGACRQVMMELMSSEALVVSCCDGDDNHAWRMGDLLPEPFLPD